MEEIKIHLENDLPFCKLSKTFPDVKFYRWCNSTVDYIEFYGDELKKVENYLPEIEKSLNTNIVYKSVNQNRMAIMLSCRCNVHNSTIRMAESKNLLWRAPVLYENGGEELNLISTKMEDFSLLFDQFTQIGKASINMKRTIDPALIRDVYTISISEVFAGITEKQLRYIIDAISMGYYSIPKRSDLKDIAEANSISDSTMQEHLKKAENKIMTSLYPYLNLFLESNGLRKKNS
ncbi:MAG: helix-turn-helix domain-containing protein [Thermoplasmata archaeon]